MSSSKEEKKVRRKGHTMETKFWEYIKWIHILNIIYGVFRLMFHACKCNTRQLLECGIVIVGGLVGYIAEEFVSCPLSGALSRIPTQFLSNLTEYAIEMTVGGLVQNLIIVVSDIEFGKFNHDRMAKRSEPIDIETMIYRIFKNTPFLGALYSIVRCCIKDQSSCVINMIANSIGSTVCCLIAAIAAPHAHEECHNLFTHFEDDIARSWASILNLSIICITETFGKSAEIGIEKVGEKVVRNGESETMI